MCRAITIKVLSLNVISYFLRLSHGRADLDTASLLHRAARVNTLD